MPLSACEKCWDTICCCGWKYRNWTPEAIERLRTTLLRVKMINEMHPDRTDEEFDKMMIEGDQ